MSGPPPQTGFGSSIRRSGTCRPRPNINRLDQAPDARFYKCRRCRNHVLSLDNCLYNVLILNGIICQDPVNVWADDIRRRFVFLRQPVVRVFCNACQLNLGHKFVMVETPTEAIQEGRFVLYRDRMLFWNGTREVYAHTNEPVEDN